MTTSAPELPSPPTSSTTRQRLFGGPETCGTARTWPKHRILFLLAGTFTLAGTALAAGVNPWFALLPAAVGVNQLLFVATAWCPASAVLDRVVPTAGD